MKQIREYSKIVAALMCVFLLCSNEITVFATEGIEVVNSEEIMTLENTAEVEMEEAEETTPTGELEGNVIEVSDCTEFRTALTAINAAGALVPAGELAEQYTVVLMNDIIADGNGTRKNPEQDPNKNVYYYFELTPGANVKIDGNGHCIFPAPEVKEKREYVSYEMFHASNAGLELENVTIDAQGEEGYLSTNVNLKGGKLVIQSGTWITGGCDRYGAGVRALRDTSGIGTTVIMNGGEISGNHVGVGLTIPSPGGGAGIQAVGANTSFVMNGGKIANNVAHAGTNGGGIQAAIGAKLTMNGGEISGNCAQEHFGGGVHLFQESEMTINGGEFKDNYAFSGGAVHVNMQSSLTVNGGTFIGNRAGSEFTEEYESGDGGGAIAVTGSSTAKFDGGSIKNSYSDLSGGAIQIFNNSHVELNNTEIAENVAETHAGAICVADANDPAKPEKKSTVKIYNSKIHDNVAKSTEEGIESDPFSPGGGALYAHQNCEIILGEGTEIFNNCTENCGSGGAVYLTYGGTLDINGAVLRNNYSANHGGAIYIDDASADGTIHGSQMMLKDGLIAGNVAAGNGGAVFLAGEDNAPGASCVMDGGVITDNHAKQQGGGFYLSGADEGERTAVLTMNAGAVYFNVAGREGNESSGKDEAGAEIYAEGKTTSMTLPTAEQISEYIQNIGTFVPDEDRDVWFTAWYEDYSDQDPEYGKADGKSEMGVHTGRYMTSKVLDRQEYHPSVECKEYEALILDRSTQLELKKTVSGKEIIKGETYEFEITLPNLPSMEIAGKKYPVTSSVTVKNDAIGSLENGQQYVVVDADGQVKLKMKAGESVRIEGLPAGTQFRIWERANGGAVSTEIAVANAASQNIAQNERKIEGKTNQEWKKETDYTKTTVVYNNVYDDKESDEPNKPDESKEQPSQIPSTGDEADVGLWLAFMGIALCGIAMASVNLRRQRKNQKQ